MRCVFAKPTKGTRAFDSICKTNRIVIFFLLFLNGPASFQLPVLSMLNLQ